MFGTKLNHETRVFLANSELSGIDSITINSQTPTQAVSILGLEEGLLLPAGPYQGDISLTRYLIYNDPLLAYTGDLYTSGSIHYNNSSYGFNFAYLTNYSVSCAVGALPKVSANLVTYREMTSGYSASGAVTAHNTIDIPTQGSISVTSDGSTTNRVIGFDYSITIPRRPNHHELTSLFTEVALIPPLVFSAQIQIDVDDAFMLDSQSNALSTELKYDTGVVTISINGRDGNSIQSLTIPNANLIGEQLTKTNNGSLKLVRTYVGRAGT
jgi:hypothetical protein